MRAQPAAVGEAAVLALPNGDHRQITIAGKSATAVERLFSLSSRSPAPDRIEDVAARQRVRLMVAGVRERIQIPASKLFHLLGAELPDAGMGRRLHVRVPGLGQIPRRQAIVSSRMLIGSKPAPVSAALHAADDPSSSLWSVRTMPNAAAW